MESTKKKITKEVNAQATLLSTKDALDGCKTRDDLNILDVFLESSHSQRRNAVVYPLADISRRKSSLEKTCACIKQ